MNDQSSQIILYQTDDGKTKVEVKMVGETVWLSQKLMGELFDCSSDNVGLHLKNVFKSAELSEKSVAEDFSVTASDGKTYNALLIKEKQNRIFFKSWSVAPKGRHVFHITFAYKRSAGRYNLGGATYCRSICTNVGDTIYR